jgi:hypothetical protein
MRFFRWSQVFEDRKVYPYIPVKVRDTEVAYWFWLLFSIAAAFVGLAIMLSAPDGHLKQMLLGLFIAIDGAISWAVVKIVVHVRLAMYWIIWDSQNRKKDEYHGQ